MHGGTVGGATPAERALPISETVTGVYEQILGEILSGQRPAGSVIRDLDVAQALGVSRTPVREAILLLRNAGVLEVVASRYTRVATLDEEDALRLSLVWFGLFSLVVEELLASDLEIDLERLEAEHEASRRSADDPRAFVISSGRFFDYAVSRSGNPHLVRAISSVAHAIRLAIVSLPVGPEVESVLQAQAQLIEATRTRDLVLGRASISTLQAIGASGR